MALKQNYKDDILDTSQNVKRKYQMENNGDGTVSFTDVTEYTQHGDSFGSGDINATNGKVNTLDANLDGFKFYPTGTGIVGLIADDSAYTDEDGNYVVWGTATANQLVEDNPNTYKSVPSEEDTRGLVGEDTAKSFGGGSVKFEKMTILNTYAQAYQSSSACTLFCDTFESPDIQPIHFEVSRTTGTNINQYLSAVITANGGYYYDSITVKALLKGKYRLLGTGDNINRIVDANIGDTLITCRSNNGTGTAWQSLPCIGNNANNGKALFIQYLGE